MAQIFLGSGDNIFTAATAGDEIYGEGGNDNLTASAGGNRLNGGDGDDVLNGGAGNDTLVGDSSVGSNSINVMKGFGGDDQITSLSWFDQIDGGAGRDSVVSNAQITGQVIDGGIGNDTINIQSLFFVDLPVFISMASTFVCIVNGINGATYLNFENLQVRTGTGANIITGGAGNDTLLTAYKNGTNATNEFEAGTINGGAGSDLIGFNGIARLGSGIHQMNGGDGVDRLTWTNGISAITDLAIDAKLGTMTALGRQFASFSNFETVEFRSFDVLAGVFTYNGSNTIDSITVSFNSGMIKTFGGNDNVQIGSGVANIDGGLGNDAIRAGNAAAGGSVLHGGAGNDIVDNFGGQSDVFGDDGNDVLLSSNGRSHLSGGNGNDSISMVNVSSMQGTGRALIEGGAGRDDLTIQLFFLSSGVTVDFSAATVNIAGGPTITGIEAINATGTIGADKMTASNNALGSAANKLFGSNGNDILRASSNGATLDGGFGLDKLIGGIGSDVLIGYGDADQLTGGGGDDQLFGGVGKDRLTGGAGSDDFAFTAYFDTGSAEATRDVITDFIRAEGDKIDLSVVDANQLVLLDQEFSFIGKAAFGNKAGELRYQQFDLAGSVDDYTLLSGDINGDGISDFTIEVSGLIAFKAADFIL